MVFRHQVAPKVHRFVRPRRLIRKLGRMCSKGREDDIHGLGYNFESLKETRKGRVKKIQPKRGKTD